MMEMPPLPHPRMQDEPRVDGLLTHWFTEDQMRAYGESCARMAREQERERIAVLVRDWDENTETEPAMERLVSAIRKG